jgi:hypothetical protein
MALVAVPGCGDDSKDDNAPAGHEGTRQAAASAQETGQSPGYTPTGQILSDSGFKPTVNGFSFENYGPGYQNMTAAEVLHLFGPRVCASGTTAADCVLKPQAEAWMNATNEAMDGGHCYGFSLTALFMFEQLLNPLDYGGAAVPALPLFGNPALQRRIAESWALQVTPNSEDAEYWGPPNVILDWFIQELPKTSETWTIGFFKRDYTGGHAVTPYAVEDRGDGKYGVLIYDNNHPGVTRAFEFDRNANSWRYQASANPDLPEGVYEGDAQSQTLFIVPTSAGEGVQRCPFCKEDPGRERLRPKLRTPPPGLERRPLPGDYDTIMLAGDSVNHGHLLLTDANGKRTGYVDGKIVNEIPGARVRPVLMARTWAEAPEPIYQVPSGLKLTITLDGSDLDAPDDESVSIIGSDHSAVASNIILRPDARDRLELSADATRLEYTADSDQAQAPRLEVALDRPGAAFKFAVATPRLTDGASVTATAEAVGGRPTLDVQATGVAGTFSLAATEIRPSGRRTARGKRARVPSGGSTQLSLPRRR